MAKISEKKKLAALQVDGSRQSEPLRECVKGALEHYFECLDGHATCNLHELVLNEVEAPLFEVVMAYTRGNQSRAAELLGINRGTLRKKLKLYKIV